MADYGDRTQINWSWAAQSGATRPLDNAQIHTVVDGERTYVLADLPRAVAPTALLHVIRGGLDPVIVPFNDIDPNTDPRSDRWVRFFSRPSKLADKSAVRVRIIAGRRPNRKNSFAPQI